MNEQDSRRGSALTAEFGPDPERAAFDRWFSAATFETMGNDWQWAAWQAGAAWRREYDAAPELIVELAEALQVRRILEEIKKVASIHPAADMPTPFQSAWQQCCEEIFYRATGEEWHMDEDANRFARRPANDPMA
jgi:hypothetical protein